MIRRTITLLTITGLLTATLTLPASASHTGQSSDTDSVVCAGPYYGNLKSRGYGYQWQVHVHDGQVEEAASASGWYYHWEAWGLHPSGTTQWVTVTAGGQQTSAWAYCPDSGIR